MKRQRALSKKAERNRTCHLAIKEIKAGNCSLPDMGWAINEVCRRAPKKLQMLATKTINRSCGGRLHGSGQLGGYRVSFKHRRLKGMQTLCIEAPSKEIALEWAKGMARGAKVTSVAKQRCGLKR